MGKIVAKGKSEKCTEYGEVTITITGTEKVESINVEGKTLDIVDRDMLQAKVEYYIEVPRSAFPAYIPEPNTMLAAYAAMKWMFLIYGKGSVDVEGDIGTIPTPYGEDAIY